MNVDWSISVGSLIQVVAFLGGGLFAFAALKTSVGQLQRDVGGVQEEIKEMGKILTKMAVAETRLDNADRRLTNVESDLRDLRRGEGFIRGHRNSVEGEYP